MGIELFESIKGKVCLITGGAGVLGKDMAHGLAAAGMKVALLDYNKEAGEEAAKELTEKTGTRVVAVGGNVLDKEVLENARKEIHDLYGPVDALINCAGGNSPTGTTQREFFTNDAMGALDETFLGLDIEGFRKTFDLNFIGTLLPSMIFSQDMLEKGGVILNISSMSAFHPLTKVSAYSAAKAAVSNFTEWLATHLAQMNIRVNAMAPGFFLTNQNRFLLTDEKTGELTPRGHKIINNTPMGRFGEPEELIGTAIYLLSDASKFVNGVVIPVDGGFNAYSGV